jgi:GNAT superfamily N-acetyltransferase
VIKVKKLTSDLVPDFFRLHSEANGMAWCNCVAWWVPTWEEFESSSSESNRRLREELFERGEFDGYLIYDDLEPVGWCQVGLKNRLPKLIQHFPSSSDDRTFAITCFFIVEAYRKQRLAAVFLEAILEDLMQQGVSSVEAYPKKLVDLPDDEVWLGPMSLFINAGFRLAEHDGNERVLVRQL